MSELLGVVAYPARSKASLVPSGDQVKETASARSTGVKRAAPVPSLFTVQTWADPAGPHNTPASLTKATLAPFGDQEGDMKPEQFVVTVPGNTCWPVPSAP